MNTGTPEMQARRPSPGAMLLVGVCLLAISTCAQLPSADLSASDAGEVEGGPLTPASTPVAADEATLGTALAPPPLPGMAAPAEPAAGDEVAEASSGADPPAAPAAPRPGEPGEPGEPGDAGEREEPGEPGEPGEPVDQPEPQPAVTAVDLPSVQVQQPKIRLEGPAAPGEDRLGAARQVSGVAYAASLTVAEMPIATAEGPSTVSVAAVDVEGFRVLTPQVTADAVEVWKRIAEGDAAFTHDVGNRLELELGSRVPAGGADETLRVGAYASNGVPPVADAIVSQDTADKLGLRGTETLLVSVAAGADSEAVAAALASATGLRAEVLADPETRRAFLTGADARNQFEPFTYIDNGDGMIQMDPEWVRRNIVSAQVPIFRGNLICHRLLIPQLRGALQEVEDAGLAELIDPSQYGGCWVPRHIDFDPNKPLSMHSWGLAVDFNVSTNGLGDIPQMDPRIVEIFDRWGFVWGGRWSRPDGMHFEIGAVLESPEG